MVIAYALFHTLIAAKSPVVVKPHGQTKELCSDAYADSQVALSDKVREHEKTAGYVRLLQTEVHYETPFYGADGRIQQKRSKGVFYGTAYAYQRRGDYSGQRLRHDRERHRAGPRRLGPARRHDERDPEKRNETESRCGSGVHPAGLDVPSGAEASGSRSDGLARRAQAEQLEAVVVDAVAGLARDLAYDRPEP